MSGEQRAESGEQCFESGKLIFWYLDFRKTNAYYHRNGRIFDLELAILKKRYPKSMEVYPKYSINSIHWTLPLQLVMTSPLSICIRTHVIMQPPSTKAKFSLSRNKLYLTFVGRIGKN